VPTAQRLSRRGESMRGHARVCTGGIEHAPAARRPPLQCVRRAHLSLRSCASGPRTHAMMASVYYRHALCTLERFTACTLGRLRGCWRITWPS
jgi:hypothetical protein